MKADKKMPRTSKPVCTRTDPGGLLPAMLLAVALSGCSLLSPDTRPENAGIDVGMAALNGGSPRVALAVSQNILSKSPDDVRALVIRGNALAQLAQNDGAVAAFQQALRKDPNAAQARLGLARIRLTTDPTEAEGLLRDVLIAEPNNVSAQTDLGVALDLLGQHAEAQTFYQRVLHDHPDNGAVQVNLALSLAMSGDSAGALRLIEPLARDQGASQKVKHNYAAILTMAGRRGDAAAVLQRDLSAEDTNRALAAYKTGTAIVSGLPVRPAPAPVQVAAAPPPATVAPAPPPAQVAVVPPPVVAATAVPTTQVTTTPPPAPAVAAPSPVQVATAPKPAQAPEPSLPLKVAPELLPVEAQTERPIPTSPMLVATAKSADTPAPAAAVPTVRTAAAPASPAVPVAKPEPVVTAQAPRRPAPPTTVTVEVTETSAPLSAVPPAARPSTAPAAAVSVPTPQTPAPRLSAVPDAPATTALAETEIGPHVQLGAFDSEAAARREWARLQLLLPSVLAGRDPAITTVVRDGTTYWRLRTWGFVDQAAARSFCAQILAASPRCLVYGA